MQLHPHQILAKKVMVDVLTPLFSASRPDTLGRQASVASLPIAFLDDVYRAETRETLLSVYAAWTQKIIAAERCSVSLMDAENQLVVVGLTGQAALQEGATTSLPEKALNAVIKQQESLYVPDLIAIPHPTAQAAAADGFCSAFVAPIRSGGFGFGTLTATFRTPVEDPALVLTKLEAMARCFGTQLLQVQQMNSLEALANSDPLTGTLNRRAFDEITPISWMDWKVKNVPFALLTLDIDKFKSVNDTHGHGVGDEVLKQLAHRVNANIRGSDALFRLGGEEFGVFLPTASKERAMQVAERIYNALRATPFVIGDLILPVTASFGVAEVTEADRSINDVIKRADEALYEAKDGGRDQIIWGAK